MIDAIKVQIFPDIRSHLQIRTRLAFDRDKPDQSLLLRLLKVSLFMFYLNMVDSQCYSSCWNYLGDLPNTQRYSGLVFEPCKPPHPSKSYLWCWGCEILATSQNLQRSNGPWLWLLRAGLCWAWTMDSWLGLGLVSKIRFPHKTISGCVEAHTFCGTLNINPIKLSFWKLIW